jgi:hypothetical protein
MVCGIVAVQVVTTFQRITICGYYMPVKDWSVTVQPGSSLQLLSGIAGTIGALNGYDKQFFPGSHTAILGTLNPLVMRDMKSRGKKHLARWRLHLEPRAAKYFMSGYLVIGCNRYYGGLHSRKRDEFAQIRFNGNWKDKILLRSKPQDHSDYFCLRPLPKGLPLLEPFSSMETRYAWVLRPPEINLDGWQTLEIELGPYGNWDIDFIGIVYKSKPRHRIFISYSSKDKVIANALYAHLRKSGQRVWIDRVEILAGVSILKRIADAIGEVDLVVALLSNNSVSSRWVRTELEIAATNEINGARPHVIPVVLDDCPIPAFLSHRRHIFLREPRRMYARAVAEIRRALNAPDEAR